MKWTFGLLHFADFYLRFLFASGEFARDVLLQCERLSFKKQKAVSLKMKQHHLKQ